MDHLELAKTYVKLAARDKKLTSDERNTRVQYTIAHALIDIAESLRWFKEQKEYDVKQEHMDRLGQT